MSPDYAVLALTRIIAACGAGLYTPNASAAAAVSVPPHRRGAALALVFGGLTLANVLGVPLGTFLGSTYNWRVTFLLVAALGVLAGIGVAALLRELPPPAATSLRTRIGLLGDRRVLVALLVMTAGMTGGFTFYTYIAASLTAVAGFHFVSRDLTYFLFISGLCGVAGGQLGGRLADRFPSRTVLTAALAATAASLLVFPLLAGTFIGAAVAVGLFGITSTLVTVPNQHHLASLAPGAVTEVMALNGSALYVGISLAGGFGGVLLSTAGAGALPYAAGCLILAATLVLALAGRRSSSGSGTAEDAGSGAPATSEPRP